MIITAIYDQIFSKHLRPKGQTLCVFCTLGRPRTSLVINPASLVAFVLQPRTRKDENQTTSKLQGMQQPLASLAHLRGPIIILDISDFTMVCHNQTHRRKIASNQITRLHMGCIACYLGIWRSIQRNALPLLVHLANTQLQRHARCQLDLARQPSHL